MILQFHMTPTATARGDLKDRGSPAGRKRHRLGLLGIGPLELLMRSFHWSSHTCLHATATDATRPLDSCFEHALIHESLTLPRHSYFAGRGNSVLLLLFEPVCHDECQLSTRSVLIVELFVESENSHAICYYRARYCTAEQVRLHSFRPGLGRQCVK